MHHTINENLWKRTFFPFWISQVFSIFGSALVQFTLVWWLTRETGSASVLATASMAALVPEILIQPFAGALVDRLNRKAIIILADAAVAAATLGLAVLFFMDRMSVWHVYLIMMVRAVGGAFHYPAEMASISLMVPEKHLARIAGLNQAMQGIMTITAAPMGALILELLDVEGSLFIDVITAIAAIAIVSIIHIPRQAELENHSRGWFAMIIRDLRDGFRYLTNWKGLMVLTGIALVFKLALTPAFSLIPLLVNKHLGGDAAQYSLLQVSSGIGIILGGFFLGIWGGFKKKIHTSFSGAVGVGLGILLMGCLPYGKFYWSLAPMFLVGFMIPITDGPLHAILQSCVDNEYQGRVMTLFGSVLNLSGPIGLAAAGPVSDALGIQSWFLAAGLLIFASIVYGLSNSHLMNLDAGPKRQSVAERI
jgi:DHA3 family macrolide efflux protein-like MFS transporter